MKISEIIAESVHDNLVYHATTLQGLQGMIKSGQILPSGEKTAHGWGGGGIGDHGSISLTRDRNYFPFDFTDVQITLDRDALANNIKIRPHNFGGRYEAEERVDRAVPFTSRYVKQVSFRNDPPSRSMQAELKKLGISVQQYRELPPVNRQYDYSINPKDHGDQKLDWRIEDNNGTSWKRLTDMTASEAQSVLDDYEMRMKPAAQRDNPDYPKRYRLVQDK